MLLEEFFSIFPISIIISILAGYFIYVSINNFLGNESKKEIFSEFKEKEIFATSTFIGLFIFILSYILIIVFNPNILDFCKLDGVGCIEALKNFFLIISLLILSASFTLFIIIYAKIPLILRQIGALIFVIIVLILIVNVPQSENSFWKQPVNITKQGKNYFVTFYLINNDNFEKLVTNLSLNCGEKHLDFNSTTCQSEIPAVLSPEKITSISCPIKREPFLKKCETIGSVINGFTIYPKPILGEDLLSSFE